ncbi:MAG: YIP1 family protein [Marinovum sp.]|nr:YIP1 family protein [Marinovum sp.]
MTTRIDWTLPSILEMAWRSVTEPKRVAADLIEADLPESVLWPGLILVVLIATIISGVINLLSPATGPLAEFVFSPFVSAFLSFAGLAIVIFALHWTGQMFRGVGRLNDMILIITWAQFVLFIGQMALVVTVLILPVLGVLGFFAYFAAAIWMMVAFVDAVHGFDNLAKALGVILVALVGVAFGVAILFSIVDFSAGGIVSNV